MLQAIAAVISLVGIFVYFVGWTYLYSYFEFFRIDVYELEPSVQYVLVYSFPALRYAADHIFWQPVAVVTLLIFGGFMVWALAFARPSLRVTARVMAVLAGLIWVFPVAYNSAWQAGIEAARSKWMESSNPIILHGSLVREGCITATAGIRASLSCHNERLALREIISTPRFHYFFMRDGCPIAKYRTCGGLIFKVAADGSTYLTTLHAGEPRFESIGPKSGKAILAPSSAA